MIGVPRLLATLASVSTASGTTESAAASASHALPSLTGESVYWLHSAVAVWLMLRTFALATDPARHGVAGRRLIEAGLVLLATVSWLGAIQTIDSWLLLGAVELVTIASLLTAWLRTQPVAAASTTADPVVVAVADVTAADPTPTATERANPSPGLAFSHVLCLWLLAAVPACSGALLLNWESHSRGGAALSRIEAEPDADSVTDGSSTDPLSTPDAGRGAPQKADPASQPIRLELPLPDQMSTGSTRRSDRLILAWLLILWSFATRCGLLPTLGLWQRVWCSASDAGCQPALVPLHTVSLIAIVRIHAAVDAAAVPTWQAGWLAVIVSSGVLIGGQLFGEGRLFRWFALWSVLATLLALLPITSAGTASSQAGSIAVAAWGVPTQQANEAAVLAAVAQLQLAMGLVWLAWRFGPTAASTGQLADVWSGAGRSHPLSAVAISLGLVAAIGPVGWPGGTARLHQLIQLTSQSQLRGTEQLAPQDALWAASLAGLALLIPLASRATQMWRLVWLEPCWGALSAAGSPRIRWERTVGWALLSLLVVWSCW